MLTKAVINKTTVFLVETHTDETRAGPVFCFNEEGRARGLLIYVSFFLFFSHNKQRVSCRCGDSLQTKLLCLL